MSFASMSSFMSLVRTVRLSFRGKPSVHLATSSRQLCTRLVGQMTAAVVISPLLLPGSMHEYSSVWIVAIV